MHAPGYVIEEKIVKEVVKRYNYVPKSHNWGVLVLCCWWCSGSKQIEYGEELGLKGKDGRDSLKYYLRRMGWTWERRIRACLNRWKGGRLCNWAPVWSIITKVHLDLLWDWLLNANGWKGNRDRCWKKALICRIVTKMFFFDWLTSLATWESDKEFLYRLKTNA